MSKTLYPIDSLRFYTEDELAFRDTLVDRISREVKNTLTSINRAWSFYRVEGPLLAPREFVSPSYDEGDIFITQIVRANQQLVLRPETTKTSYLFAEHFEQKLKKHAFPMCVWQLGKSFRVEKSDGASPSKLRFNEFYQLEFQCIYSEDTKADYRAPLIVDVSKEIDRLLMTSSRIVESDRLPSYSESTLDIEVPFNGEWKEVASCSIRTDYKEGMKVCEIALGIDRLTEIYYQSK